MFSKISGVLLLSYIMTVVGGAGYLLSPPPVIGQIVSVPSEAIIWGLFYVVGGLISSVSSALRPIVLSRITSLWYFEISGVFLIITANLVHSYAIYTDSILSSEYNLLAFASILLSFSILLSARVVEVLSLVRYLKQYASLETS